MIKVSKLFCLIFLVAAAPVIHAQNNVDPVAAASDEAIRRQALTIQLRRTLAEAQVARQHGDLITAHKLYERCFDYVTQIGPGGIESEAKQTVLGLSAVLFDMARQYQVEHRFDKADEQFA